MRLRMTPFFLFIILAILCSAAFAQQDGGSDYLVQSVRPQYLAPAEILTIIGAESMGNWSLVQWQAGNDRHHVDIRINETSNVLILSGTQSDIDLAKSLITAADVSPHQIEIEVKMVEIYTDRADDLGIDWESLIQDISPSFTYNYQESDANTDQIDQQRTTYSNYNQRSSEAKRLNRDFRVSSSFYLGNHLNLIQESGAGRIFNAPKILTLNNHRATILDGSRTTYVAQVSSYNNIYRTDSMDAGIILSVLPSIGESGYMTLDITAEVTSLTRSTCGGSPTKDGQIIENKVIIKDGESLVLGGMTRTVEHKSKKRFPILGHLIPFLFSRETTQNEHVQTIMVLTPRIIDLRTNMNPSAQEMLNPPEPEPGR